MHHFELSLRINERSYDELGRNRFFFLKKRTLKQNFPIFSRNVLKCLNDHRVKLAARILFDLGTGFVVRSAVTKDPLADHGVQGVNNGEDTSANINCFATKSFWIA